MVAASTAFLLRDTTAVVQPTNQYGAPAASATSGISLQGLIAPHAEILNLIESFLQLKGDVASRFYNLVSENYDLIRGVVNVAVSKIATLHWFSLTGVQILRRVIEFIVQCVSQWEIVVPSISFDGSHQTSGSVPNTDYGTPSGTAGEFNAGTGFYQR